MTHFYQRTQKEDGTYDTELLYVFNDLTIAEEYCEIKNAQLEERGIPSNVCHYYASYA